MKKIGLLGGMSWESTVPYYQIINRVTNERLGGLHSADLVLYSVDFHEIEQLQHAARWDETAKILADCAVSIEAAGAECLVLCTNTMHKVADAIQARIGVPLLHIADAVALEIRDEGMAKVGLLGTSFTMEQEFYRGRLRERHGLEVIIPEEEDRQTVHQVIYDELCLGQVLDGSRERFVRIIDKLIRDGAEGVILGCTEIGLLVAPDDVSCTLFDSTDIHARAAVDWAIT